MGREALRLTYPSGATASGLSYSAPTLITFPKKRLGSLRISRLANVRALLRYVKDTMRAQKVKSYFQNNLRAKSERFVAWHETFSKKEIDLSPLSAKVFPMQHRINAITKLNETLAKARQLFGRDFPAPRVTFDLRGRTAGMAHYTQNLIRLNDVLLRENGDAFVARTVPHEVAHLLAHQIYGHGIRPHGPEWKNVMRRLGLVPSRCHSYDTTNAVTRRVEKFSMFCACQEHKVTRRVVAKVEMGARYTCRKCRTPIASQKGAIAMGARCNFTIS